MKIDKIEVDIVAIRRDLNLMEEHVKHMADQLYALLMLHVEATAMNMSMVAGLCENAGIDIEPILARSNEMSDAVKDVARNSKSTSKLWREGLMLVVKDEEG